MSKLNIRDHTVTKRPLEDLYIFEKNMIVEVVQAHEEKIREWLVGAPVCDLLKQHYILHAGVMYAEEPFEVVRTDQSGTFMLACHAGKGEVLVDGKWKTVSAGEACLLPPFVVNALRCIEGEKWAFCWVRYLESRDAVPIVTEVSPVRGRYDPDPLRHAIRGLIAETRGKESHARQHHWVELMHHYVKQFSQSHQKDERLWKLWKAVEPYYDKPLTLKDLAQLAGVSEEHLRRLCKKQLGRSPMQHLTFLRMRRACEMLVTTDEKIEAISCAVGYRSVYYFSNSFVKWVGVRPSVYRE